MYSKDVVIENEVGLHARPAARFVQAAATFDSDIRILKGDNEVDGKSMLSVMMLGIDKGTKITIKAIGVDEVSAVDYLVNLIKNEINVN